MKKDDKKDDKKEIKHKPKQFCERPFDLYAKECVTFEYIHNIDNYKEWLKSRNK